MQSTAIPGPYQEGTNTMRCLLAPDALDMGNWRTTKVTKQELANVLITFDARAIMVWTDISAKEMKAVPAPDRTPGNPDRDLRYLDEVIGEPVLEESDGHMTARLILLDAGARTKCSIVHCKDRDLEWCSVSVRSTWRAAKADAVIFLKDLLREIEQTRHNRAQKKIP